jgi:pyruvate formate lyase activating enzyme
VADLKVGGFTPLTSIDFPGRLAAVVFCQGCLALRLLPQPAPDPGRQPVRAGLGRRAGILARRRGLLDGVVFSGGEPTLQAALPAAMRDVRQLGFEVALHTAGMYPDRLEAALPWVDWVGFDIKAPAHRYDHVTGTPGSATRVMDSLERLVASGVAYECRTTWDPALFDEAELMALLHTLAEKGVRAGRCSLQSRRNAGAAPGGDCRPHRSGVPADCRANAGLIYSATKRCHAPVSRTRQPFRNVVGPALRPDRVRSIRRCRTRS